MEVDGKRPPKTLDWRVSFPTGCPVPVSTHELCVALGWVCNDFEQRSDSWIWVFISIISFLPRIHIMPTLCDSLLWLFSNPGGYWHHWMNWIIFYRYLIEQNIYPGWKTSRFAIILTSQWKIDLRVSIIKWAILNYTVTQRSQVNRISSLQRVAAFPIFSYWKLRKCHLGINWQWQIKGAFRYLHIDNFWNKQ